MRVPVDTGASGFGRLYFEMKGQIMGTNYYLHYEPCECCGRSDEPSHIGKSSAGWCFALHVDPDYEINSLEDWKINFHKPGNTIEDEDGQEISQEDMTTTAICRSLMAETKWTTFPVPVSPPTPVTSGSEIVMSKTGTRQEGWSSSSCNIQTGCAHGCRYCYARWDWMRWAPKDDKDSRKGCDWTNEVIRQHAVDKGYRKRDGVIMFPTTHDITEHNYKQCGIVLQKLLDAGNQVLVVTKGGYYAQVVLLSAAIRPYLGRLEARITIGAISNIILSFWEPHAPNYHRRLRTLELLRLNGINTSVSMEPNLDPAHTVELVQNVAPAVSGKIWIGKCNDIRQRTAWYRKYILKTIPYMGPLVRLDNEVSRIESHQTDEAVMKIYDKLKDHPKIEWKDSYAKVIKEAKELSDLHTSDFEELSITPTWID